MIEASGRRVNNTTMLSNTLTQGKKKKTKTKLVKRHRKDPRGGRKNDEIQNQMIGNGQAAAFSYIQSGIGLVDRSHRQ